MTCILLFGSCILAAGLHVHRHGPEPQLDHGLGRAGRLEQPLQRELLRRATACHISHTATHPPLQPSPADLLPNLAMLPKRRFDACSQLSREPPFAPRTPSFQSPSPPPRACCAWHPVTPHMPLPSYRLVHVAKRSSGRAISRLAFWIFPPCRAVHPCRLYLRAVCFFFSGGGLAACETGTGRARARAASSCPYPVCLLVTVPAWPPPRDCACLPASS